MIRYLFDTDHVSLQERGHRPILARVAAVAVGEIAVSAISVEEVLRGRLAILARQLDGELLVRTYGKLIEAASRFSPAPLEP